MKSIRALTVLAIATTSSSFVEGNLRGTNESNRSLRDNIRRLVTDNIDTDNIINALTPDLEQIQSMILNNDWFVGFGETVRFQPDPKEEISYPMTP